MKLDYLPGADAEVSFTIHTAFIFNKQPTPVWQEEWRLLKFSARTDLDGGLLESFNGYTTVPPPSKAECDFSDFRFANPETGQPYLKLVPGPKGCGCAIL